MKNPPITDNNKDIFEFDKGTDEVYINLFKNIFFKDSDMLSEILSWLDDQKNIASLKLTSKFFNEILSDEKYSFEKRLTKLTVNQLGRQAENLLQLNEPNMLLLAEDSNNFLFKYGPTNSLMLEGSDNPFAVREGITRQRLLNRNMRRSANTISSMLLMVGAIMLVMFDDSNIKLLPAILLVLLAGIWQILSCCEHAPCINDPNPNASFASRSSLLMQILIHCILVGPAPIITFFQLTCINNSAKSRARTHDWAPTNITIKKLSHTLKMQEMLLKKMQDKIKDGSVAIINEDDKKPAEKTLNALLKNISTYLELLTASDQVDTETKMNINDNSPLLSDDNSPNTQDMNLQKTKQTTSLVDPAKLNYNQVINFCININMLMKEDKLDSLKENVTNFMAKSNCFFVPTKNKNEASDSSKDREPQLSQ